MLCCGPIITKHSQGCTKIIYYKPFIGLYKDHLLPTFIGLYKDHSVLQSAHWVCTKITYYKAFAGLYKDHLLQAFIGLYKDHLLQTFIGFVQRSLITKHSFLPLSSVFTSVRTTTGTLLMIFFYLDDLEQNMIFVIRYILSVIVFEARVQSSL